MIFDQSLSLNCKRTTFQKLEQKLFQSQSGQSFMIRQVRRNDTPRLVDLLHRLSQRSHYLRFLTPKPQISDEVVWREAFRVTESDPLLELALVATLQEQEEEPVIAIAELVRPTKTAQVGEIAILVRDDYQREGIGSILTSRLVQLAALYGITTMQADILAENEGVRRMVNNLHLPYTLKTQYGQSHLQINLKAA